MLTFHGDKPQPFCDGHSRRDFLRVGALTLGGLTLPNLLRARAGNAGSGAKSVIMIYLGGAPSHIDMYDLKPDAPAEIRGEFKPISSNVPGFDVCELMPLQAKIADKLALVRNMRFTEVDHICTEFVTGYPGRVVSSEPQRRHPDFGSVVSRLAPANRSGLPSYVLLGNCNGP